MDIREGRPIKYQKGSEIMVIKPEEAVAGVYIWADQIITATNKKRKVINDYMRAAAGRGPEPESGDKIICCRNCWDITDISGENALVNGTIGTIEGLYKNSRSYPIYNFPNPVPIVTTEIRTENGEWFHGIDIDYKSLKEGVKFLTPQQEFQIYRRDDLKGLEPIEFNYGYAITGHRAQGSEWEKVLVFEESFPFDKTEHARWLYTTATRASQKLVIVR
jgi:exodeoxyribonuclease-5